MLEVRSLDVYRGSLPVLFNATLSVPSGARIGIVGANGAGKSTLLHAISGLLRRVSGVITIDDQEILSTVGGRRHHVEPATIVDLGVVQVPEGRQLFGDMTVLENLRVGALRLRGAALADRLSDVVSLLPEITRLMRRRASALSGGEQQLVAIARALMARPRYLMLDEPSTGLAPRLVERLFELLARLNRDRGCAIVLVEQNVAATLEFVSAAYVLEAGQVVASGTSAQLRQNATVIKAFMGVYDA